MEFKEYELRDICKFQEGYVNPKQTKAEYFDGEVKWLRANDLQNSYVYNTSKTLTKEGFKSAGKSAKLFKPNTIAISKSGTIGRLGILKDYMCGNRAVINIESNEKLVDIKYIYYFLLQNRAYIESLAQGSVQKNLYIFILEKVKIRLPDKEKQRKILNILNNIDNKIELNNQINNNLDEQLRILFNNNFFDNIEKNNIDNYSKLTLYDVLDVIDNRGKTPQLVEYSDYPIIDVRAISGEGRIIDYKKCQKYVDEEVYNTFFRSGHPIINDILISTVGSLAEMKIYKENKGTIAQNVVGLRAKTNYPMYIYQYLKAIKNDLISYNIGSVQPSIKVTQFMKHSIYIPNDKELNKFENLAQIYTDKMFNISKENETLVQLRDTLLPKLMNGEIDLDKIEI